MISLEHNKTYIDKLGTRVKVKKVDDVLFIGNNLKMYYATNGVAVCRPFAYDLVKETDGTIKYFLKTLWSKVTKWKIEKL